MPKCQSIRGHSKQPGWLAPKPGTLSSRQPVTPRLLLAETNTVSNTCVTENSTVSETSTAVSTTTVPPIIKPDSVLLPSLLDYYRDYSSRIYVEFVETTRYSHWSCPTNGSRVFLIDQTLLSGPSQSGLGSCPPLSNVGNIASVGKDGGSVQAPLLTSNHQQTNGLSFGDGRSTVPTDSWMYSFVLSLSLKASHANIIRCLAAYLNHPPDRLQLLRPPPAGCVTSPAGFILPGYHAKLPLQPPSFGSNFQQQQPQHGGLIPPRMLLDFFEHQTSTGQQLCPVPSNFEGNLKQLLFTPTSGSSIGTGAQSVANLIPTGQFGSPFCPRSGHILGANHTVGMGMGLSDNSATLHHTPQQPQCLGQTLGTSGLMNGITTAASVAANQNIQARLYFQRLSLSITELESLCQLRCSYVDSSRIQEEADLLLVVDKTATVAELLKVAREQLQGVGLLPRMVESQDHVASCCMAFSDAVSAHSPMFSSSSTSSAAAGQATFGNSNQSTALSDPITITGSSLFSAQITGSVATVSPTNTMTTSPSTASPSRSPASLTPPPGQTSSMDERVRLAYLPMCMIKYSSLSRFYKHVFR
ncbi:unnamed protein product [Protopolystoma xenopodis]|uniref:ubiquitinyl hydrolase 1 n=1 Tax=Protopolystoma xenopodis TaxID=117903 RepID=A0A3S5BSP6_9PLAT|nr:unnamed protein product [Protopolystoma xenopodis]